jgi:hypothetical protein
MKKVLLSSLVIVLMAGMATAQGTATPSSPASQAQVTTTPSQSQQTQQTAPPASAPAASATSPQNGSPGSPAGTPTRIAPGSVIPVALTKTIDAKKAKTGDEIVAKVTQDMKTTNGNVLVPKDTKVIGHVTEAQARNKEQKESQVGIAFDRAVMKDGNAVQMPMSIQAIIGQQNDQSNAGGGGSGATAPAGGSPSSGSAGSSSGAHAGMAGSAPAPSPSAGSGMPSDTSTGKTARPPITAQTQGVVGIANLNLSPAAANAAQGSIVSSETNNVKLESGTMMLLRVNQ